MTWPTDGLGWLLLERRILSVTPDGPGEQAGLKPGDVVLAVDGRLLADVPLYAGKRAGQQVVLTVQRGTEIQDVTLMLAVPDKADLLWRSIPVVVALAFWGVTVVVFVLRPAASAPRMFFLLGQVAGLTLTTGQLSAVNVTWATRLFHLVLCALPPLLIHFYGALSAFPLSPRRRWWMPFILVSLLLALPYLLWPLSYLKQSGWHAVLRLAVRSYLGLTLLTVTLGLVYTYFTTHSADLRRRLRGLVFGTAAGFIPLLFLSLLPDVLWGSGVGLPYQVSFFFLVLIPLSHAYVIVKYDLLPLDRLLNRSLVVFVLGLLWAALYLGGVGLGMALFQDTPLLQPLVGALVTMGMAAAFTPLREWVQRVVDLLFYGGWYDYRTVVRETSRELSRTLDLERLSAWSLDTARTLRFQAAALLWPEGAELVPRSDFGYGTGVLESLRLPIGGALARYLTTAARPRWRAQIGRELATDELTEGEQALLAEERVHFWLPLVSRGTLRGVLVMGARQGEELLDAEDLDILATLAGQAAVAAENVALIEALRAQLVEVKRARDELVEAQRRLAESREAERLHLARDLHDGPVQDLYGTRLRLDAIAEEMGDDVGVMRMATVQGELLRVIDELRAICRELRPPALAPFGLEAAIRSHAGRFQEAHPELGVQVDLMHDGQTLPEKVQMALFRIYQEAISNVARHASASCVLIRFYLNEERVLLEISDDGCGFQVPERWILLARRGRLGLLGAAERADSTGGRLEVESAPGKGTVVRVVAPRRGIGDFSP